VRKIRIDQCGQLGPFRRRGTRNVGQRVRFATRAVLGNVLGEQTIDVAHKVAPVSGLSRARSFARNLEAGRAVRFSRVGR
jgi:hypothetical protein